MLFRSHVVPADPAEVERRVRQKDMCAEAARPSPSASAIAECEKPEPSRRVIMSPSGSPGIGVTRSMSPACMWSTPMTVSDVWSAQEVTGGYSLGER